MISFMFFPFFTFFIVNIDNVMFMILFYSSILIWTASFHFFDEHRLNSNVDFFFLNETMLEKHFNIMICLIIFKNNQTWLTSMIWRVKLNALSMPTFAMGMARMSAVIFVKTEYSFVKSFQWNNDDLFFWITDILADIFVMKILIWFFEMIFEFHIVYNVHNNITWISIYILI